ncbi:dehydratase IlvD1 [Apiospora arundinis]
MSPIPRTKLLQGKPGLTASRDAPQIEDPRIWAMFTDWDDVSSLRSFQQQTGEYEVYLGALSRQCAKPAELAVYHVVLDPPLSSPIAPEASQKGLLEAAPVVEVVRLYFPADLSEEVQREILADVDKSKKEFFLPNAKGCVGEPAFGFALEPAEFQGEKARVLFALAGWESAEVWTAWAESEVAKTGIAKMKGLPGLKGQELFLVRCGPK